MNLASQLAEEGWVEGVAVQTLLAELTAWAAGRDQVRAVVLVGSYARGTAAPDSDVDLVVLSEAPDALTNDVAWTAEFGIVQRTVKETWGRVTSIRAWYATGLEVEFGVTTPDWAHAADEGTRRVIDGGVRVLWDPDGAFS